VVNSSCRARLRDCDFIARRYTALYRAADYRSRGRLTELLNLAPMRLRSRRLKINGRLLRVMIYSPILAHVSPGLSAR